MMVAVAAPAAAAAKKNKKIGNTQHATPSMQRDESACVHKYGEKEQWSVGMMMERTKERERGI